MILIHRTALFNKNIYHTKDFKYTRISVLEICGKRQCHMEVLEITFLFFLYKFNSHFTNIY